jgi:dihydroflavonol-4-reductase
MSISLVTGGSGFIGGHLVAELLAAGETVRILDLRRPETLPQDAAFIEGSITDPRIVGEAMASVRHVYHTAGIPDLWLAEPKRYQEVNVDGTRIVLEAAAAAGVERLIHTSSATVLIARGDRRPITLDERRMTAEGDLIGAYARAKWRAERLALAFGDRLSVVVTLPALPLGPDDRALTPPTRMLLDFARGRNPAYIDCILNLADVRDMARGHVLAAKNGRSGERYLLSCRSVAMTDFLALVARLSGRKPPRFKAPKALAWLASLIEQEALSRLTGRPPKAPFAGTRLALRPVTLDGSRAMAALGLVATPLEQTLADALAWLAEAGHLPPSDREPG